MKITSLTNPHVKQVVKLRDRTSRAETGLTIIDGIRELEMAFKAAVEGVEIFICPEILGPGNPGIIEKIGRSGVPLFETTQEVFAKISYGDRQEGVLMVCRPKQLSFKDLKLNQAALVVVAERIEKPGNLGAILRTCDSAGVNALIIADGLTDVYNPNVIRSSLGAVFTVAVVSSSNADAFQFLKDNGMKILAAVPNAPTLYTRTDFKGASAILVGNEQGGLTEFWMKKADQKMAIPMQGAADSLNVSATAAILVYEALRQRGEG
ncbi:MAG: RNA methyltransferase [Candidatus Omnitrophota bacterium]